MGPSHHLLLSVQAFIDLPQLFFKRIPVRLQLLYFVLHSGYVVPAGGDLVVADVVVLLIAVL